jgi:hypothetical protein
MRAFLVAAAPHLTPSKHRNYNDLSHFEVCPFAACVAWGASSARSKIAARALARLSNGTVAKRFV